MTAADAVLEGEKPTDPWTAFAPEPPVTPSRVRRIGGAVGRFVSHEWTLASLAGLALAVVLTWPTLRYPMHTIPQDIWDPTLVAWMMSWSGHILTTDPAQLWHGNAFYPESYSYAFTDTLLGYAPAGMLGNGPEAAVLRYNIIFVLVHALAAVGAYALVRQLGARPVAAAVAGVAFAYAPWKLAHGGHLHVLSIGGIALALAMLARGHGWSLRYGLRPRRARWGWVLGGWLVAAWQITIGFAVGLPFAYVLAGVALTGGVLLLVRRLRRPAAKRLAARVLYADLAGGAIFAGVGIFMALPYLKVVELHPYARRSIAELKVFSPPANGFLTAPQESLLWGSAHAGARESLSWPPEMALLPGFVLIGLAITGLFLSVWSVRQRLFLLAGVLVSVILAMGTRFFGGHAGYLALYHTLPGWDAIRTPGRLVLWTTLLLAVLAAGAVTALGVRARRLAADPHVYPWGPALRALVVIPLLLVLAEGLNRTPHPTVPPQPAAMRTVAGPLLVLPTPTYDQNIMLWSTDRFLPIVNGGSGFTPASTARTREIVRSFPDPASVAHLRSMGVATVLVLRDRIAGTPWQNAADAPVDGLGVTRTEVDDTVVFTLNG